MSAKTTAAPITPRVGAQPAAPAPAPAAAGEGVRPAPASEQTLLHPTPRAAGTPASSPPLRSSFPKPEPYAVPPRAGDAVRIGGADRTALSSDYLRAAREAALGRAGSSSEPRASEPSRGGPVLGGRAAFTTTPVSRTPHEARADEAASSFRTQQSLGSEPPPPRAPVDAFAAAGERRPAVHGTVLEAPRVAPSPPLPDLPRVPPSERGPAGASRFEPVPTARTHLSERGAPAISGQSLAHISVDWSPELAESVRSAAPPPKSRAGRMLLLGAVALVLVVLGFVTLGGPLRRLVSRVAQRATVTESAAEPSAPPSVQTLSNRPADTASPAGSAETSGAAPSSAAPQPAP